MNRRIALICQGKSLPNTGKDCSVSKLESLTNNVKRVETVLRDYGNWIPYIYEVTATTALKDKINEIKNNGVDEFLFYYTGHGRGTPESFEIVGVDECDIDLLTLLKQTEIFNASVSIILDACESLAIVDNWSNPMPYEIITAAGDDSAYEVENIAGDGKWYSYFSHHFCEYMKNAEEHTNLGKFNQYLIDNYDEIDEKQKQESNYHSPTSNRYTKINTIVYGKQLYAIRDLLRRKYPILNDFKVIVLRYVSRGTQMYEHTLNTKNIDELISLLIDKESSGYLYCLLKSENMFSEYSENFTGKKCCTEYNHQINKIMVIVNHDKVADVYDIGFYVYYDSNQEDSSPIWIREKSWNDFFTKTLVEKLEYFMQSMTRPTLELVLVLPFEKINNDFESLQIKTGLDEEDRESLNEMFNISFKLFPRLESFHLPIRWIEHWKENLEAYAEATQNSYADKLCSLNASDSIANFTTFQGGKNVFLLADRSLVSLEELKMIYKKGVPFMATTLSDCCAFNTALQRLWEQRETKVKEFKLHTSEYIKACNKVHFLYDDGYEEHFLMEYNKRNSEEDNFLGEDNG